MDAGVRDYVLKDNIINIRNIIAKENEKANSTLLGKLNWKQPVLTDFAAKFVNAVKTLTAFAHHGLKNNRIP